MGKQEELARLIAADCGYMGFEFEETREQWLRTASKVMGIVADDLLKLSTLKEFHEYRIMLKAKGI